MNIALQLTDVRVALGDQRIIDGVTAAFPERSLSLVIGRSGAGKSVLWKAVAGLLPRSGGDVVVNAKPLVFVHQDPALFEDRSTLENLTFFALSRGGERVATMARLKELTDTLELGALLEVPARRLSPAQARRVALGRALMLRPGVLIVDEPTTGLDAIDADDVGAALIRAANESTLVVITHHPRTIALVGAHPRCRIWRVEGGTLRGVSEATA